MGEVVIPEVLDQLVYQFDAFEQLGFKLLVDDEGRNEACQVELHVVGQLRSQQHQGITLDVREGVIPMLQFVVIIRAVVMQDSIIE